ncbi:MAG: Major Facilitator Superfamily protein [candidate division WS6 bacterium OLB20]|uniref:Major Facilitator Superfamily protein n=1 Tax=candidate division WS6 bacterium OLB20 TaxID=1617426 RepID=A0A136LZK1_9BACT|nr:MAG: Major Facilitator Superfamily protein [candidate division WS6 bacterium OLB20]
MRVTRNETLLRQLTSNKVIWLLTLSDIFTWGSYYIISTIAGIYLAGRLGVNAVEIIGIGTAVYFVCRAVFQIPVGIITDRLERDRDEVLILAIGSILMGMSFVMYPLIDRPISYFFLQFLFGLGTAMNLNTWRKLFAKNLQKNNEGKEYGMYEVFMSMAIAAFSWVAGLVAGAGGIYFDLVMIAVGITMMLSFGWALLILTIRDRKSQD